MLDVGREIFWCATVEKFGMPVVRRIASIPFFNYVFVQERIKEGAIDKTQKIKNGQIEMTTM